MDDHYRFLRPGQTVLDCGAAPGAWSQVLAKRTNANGEQVEKRVGKVMAVDLSPFHPIVGVTSFPLSDFTSPETQKQILETIDSKFDVIVSDMAPKVSGMNSLDHEIIIDLCRKVVRFSECALKPNGTLLMKIFDGGLTKDLEKILVNMFHKVKYVKPDSSRKNSAEIYFLCLKFKIKLSNT
ncbi:hypothetical protein QYM36_006869 [Artemia franciscana]|nr:hypothetical protein QYM36_006869 [Artemia franciscana]